MRFCCRDIEELHRNSGLREFSVFTARYPDGFVFVLQHRALDPDALPPFTESPMSAVSELPLNILSMVRSKSEAVLSRFTARA